MTGLVGMAAAGDPGRGARGVDDRPYGVRQRGRAVAWGLLALATGPLGLFLVFVLAYYDAFEGEPNDVARAVVLLANLVPWWCVAVAFRALTRTAGVPWPTRLLAAVPVVTAFALYVACAVWMHDVLFFLAMLS